MSEPTQLPADPAAKPKPPNRPPNRPGTKPTPPKPGKPKPPQRPKATPLVGSDRAPITVTFEGPDLKLSITGPAWKVQKVLEAIFGTIGSPEAVIAKLKLVFGPEKARLSGK